MDPVSIWLLFRGQHTAFTHYDLNSQPMVDLFLQRFKAWDAMVEGTRPVTFLRTAISKDPTEEIKLVSAFQNALDKKNPNLDHRFVLAVHDHPEHRGESKADAKKTELLGSINERATLWRLGLEPLRPVFDKSKAVSAPSLFDRTCSGYEHIVKYSAQDSNWTPPGKLPPVFPFLTSTPPGTTSVFQHSEHLCKVEGVSAFRGTCTGIGSTLSAAMGGNRCLFCSSTDGHALQDPTLFDKKKAQKNSQQVVNEAEESDDLASQQSSSPSSMFSDEEKEEVMMASLLQQDTVAAVEHVANKLGLGSNEVYCEMLDIRRHLMETGVIPNDTKSKGSSA